MKKLLLLFSAICAGALGFGSLHRAAQQTRTATVIRSHEWAASTNRLVEMQQTATQLRREVRDKKERLRQASVHPAISQELLRLMESDELEGTPGAWSELRYQLSLGWEASPDFVLVNKRVLKHLDYPVFDSAERPSETASDLLAFSTSEQSALKSLLKRAREGWLGLTIERGEPTSDIVAQYTVRPPDPASDLSLSNNFASDITGAIGPERAGMLLERAWRELRSELGPRAAETLTVRRTVVDGEPDLIWEMKRGDRVLGNDPVRYAHYPSSWFLTLFPGGWKTLAEREDFELPNTFQKQQ
jgi:hypothetical protein